MADISRIKTLEECGVTRDDVFACVSFWLAHMPAPEPQETRKIVKAVVETLKGAGQTCFMSLGDSIWAIKREYARKMGKEACAKSNISPNAHDIDLSYKGNATTIHSRISDTQFSRIGTDPVFLVIIKSAAEWWSLKAPH